MSSPYQPSRIFLLVIVALAWSDVSNSAEVSEPSRLEISIHNEAGQSLPCRVHVTDAAGKPARPEKLPFWKDHFVCPGKAELKLPAGKYTVEIERGPEYERLERAFDLEPGKTGQFDMVIKRITDMRQQGWFSGDLHVHRPVEDIPLLMQAEDLHVAPVITWWNNRNLWTDQPPPKETAVMFDGGRIYDVMAGEDEREGGALLFFGLKQPLPITGAAREYPSPMKFVELARRQPNVWVDIEKPFWWDVPIWLACANVDSIGIANNHMCRSSMYENEAWGKPRDNARLPAPRGNGYWSQEIYYHILNCGLRIPPSAGSASGVLPNPVGYNRVYVYTASEGSLSSEADWWGGLKAGRSFVTNGPLMVVRADGQLPGHVFRAAKGEKVVIPIVINMVSNDDIPVIEIIRDGVLAAKVSLQPRQGVSTRLRRSGNTSGWWEFTNVTFQSLTFDSSGWFLVRAVTNNPRTFRFASTAPFYVEIGDAKNRVSKQSAKFFLDWVNERAERVGKKLQDPDQLREVLVYHDHARTFWQNVVDSANAD